MEDFLGSLRQNISLPMIGSVTTQLHSEYSHRCRIIMEKKDENYEKYKYYMEAFHKRRSGPAICDNNSENTDD